jgi:hypothetical protein
MNFTNLQLPDFLLADLYKTVLVELEGEVSEQKKGTTLMTKQWFLGENKKHIVILIKDEEAVYLRDEWLKFLTTILSACKLNLGDVAIINYLKKSFSYEELVENLTPEFLLLFDVTAKEIQLPFSVPFYQVQQYDNRTFLIAPSLDKMLGDSQESKIEKSKLWLSLKKIFHI